ncbi:short-chain dehydrogenase/reductase SDR [Nitzschia inconspicua]|uniref:Short-chain dehydrogenase/reductase SDR n=1 Tax=Nitzschia inconspicua TaxID=303405 RepID=A0A9K3KJT8_9STRA|nr:short-chain dehydrogenase/reductase SDR [Nitzschia inconspicua]
MSLSDLKVLVTGASSGIGRETCKILSQNYNAMVIGSARNRNALDAMLKEGSIQNFIVADVTQPGKCERIVEEAVVLMGGSITTVVNAAGGLEGGAVGDAGCNLKNYEYNMNVNCKAPFAIMMAAIPFLKQNSKKNASIVTVSSVNGKQSFAGCATYCMAKAAVDQMTRCASVDLARYGIRVNNVNPGVIMTNLHRTAGMDEESYTAFLERSIQMTHPLSSSLGRVGNPEEVAELIAFLISDKASFITGECIAIDGARQNLGAR